MNKITPLIKGVITGVLMVALSLYLIYTHRSANSWLQIFSYLLYAGGIAWTLIDYSRSDTYTGKFGDIFSQGFRCFIIVVLIMVIFTTVYTMMHPEIVEEAANRYKADLIKQGNKLPAEIDKIVSEAKKQFLTGNIMTAIFGTLIPGAIFTAAGAGLLLIRRK